MHIALWEGKTKAEQEPCLVREGVNAAKLFWWKYASSKSPPLVLELEKAGKCAWPSAPARPGSVYGNWRAQPCCDPPALREDSGEPFRLCSREWYCESCWQYEFLGSFSVHHFVVNQLDTHSSGGCCRLDLMTYGLERESNIFYFISYRQCSHQQPLIPGRKMMFSLIISKA